MIPVDTYPSIGGCMDSQSANYNPWATYEDGSCDEGYCYDYNNFINHENLHEKRNKFDLMNLPHYNK